MIGIETILAHLEEQIAYLKGERKEEPKGGMLECLSLSDGTRIYSIKGTDVRFIDNSNFVPLEKSGPYPTVEEK